MSFDTQAVTSMVDRLARSVPAFQSSEWKAEFDSPDSNSSARIAALGDYARYLLDSDDREELASLLASVEESLHQGDLATWSLIKIELLDRLVSPRRWPIADHRLANQLGPKTTRAWLQLVGESTIVNGLAAGGVSDEASWESIIAVLDGKDWSMAMLAAQALGDSGDPKFLDDLERVAESRLARENPRLRDAAVTAASKIVEGTGDRKIVGGEGEKPNTP